MGKSRKILKIWEKYYGKFGKILLKVRISILDTKSLFPAMDASRRIFLHWLLLGGAYDCSSDVTAGRRRMALGTVNRAALSIFWPQSSNFVYFLALILTKMV